MSKVLYEVRLTVSAKIRREFMVWLTEHVAEMLTFEGFLTAQILSGDHTQPDEVSVLYTLESRASFAEYEMTHADRMRSEGLTLFPEGLSAVRRLWDIQQSDHSGGV